MEPLLAHYGVELRLVHPHTLRGKCPLPTHTSKAAYTFTVQVAKNIWACQSDSCIAARHGRKGGNALDFVATMENCSIREAAVKIVSWFPEESDRGKACIDERVAKESEGQGNNPPLKFRLRGVDPSHHYLAERGITAETAALFGVGFYGGPGLMHGRIVIPIHNEVGKLVAYAGRSIDGSEPKYRFPKGFLKSIEWFNLDRVLAMKIRSVIIVEGFFDCIKVYQAGFQNVIALMGSTLTARQEEALTRCFDEATLMLDGDRAGREGTDQIAAHLSGKMKLSIAAVPEGVQPDQMAPADIRALIGDGEGTRTAAVLRDHGSEISGLQTRTSWRRL